MCSGILLRLFLTWGGKEGRRVGKQRLIKCVNDKHQLREEKALRDRMICGLDGKRLNTQIRVKES